MNFLLKFMYEYLKRHFEEQEPRGLPDFPTRSPKHGMVFVEGFMDKETRAWVYNRVGKDAGKWVRIQHNERELLSLDSKIMSRVEAINAICTSILKRLITHNFETDRLNIQISSRPTVAGNGVTSSQVHTLILGEEAIKQMESLPRPFAPPQVPNHTYGQPYWW